MKSFLHRLRLNRQMFEESIQRSTKSIFYTNFRANIICNALQKQDKHSFSTVITTNDPRCRDQCTVDDRTKGMMFKYENGKKRKQ